MAAFLYVTTSVITLALLLTSSVLKSSR